MPTFDPFDMEAYADQHDGRILMPGDDLVFEEGPGGRVAALVLEVEHLSEHTGGPHRWIVRTAGPRLTPKK